MAPQQPITSCSTCPCGQASGVGAGGRCPFVDRKRPAGDTLALEGDVIRTVWIIKRGTVVLSRTGLDGVERARLVRGPGSFLGLEVLVRPTYADTMRTTESTVVCGISRESLESWLGPRGTPARTLLVQTLLATADDRPRAAAADGTAVARVARWILDEVGTSCRVPRQVVASLLGIVPETLSRSLAQLQARGMIRLTRNTITIVDRNRLEAVAS